MRRTTVSLALLLATACSSSADKDATDYTVANETASSADLIIPDVTEDQARAAIREYTRGIDGAELYYVKVMRSEGAGRYVCRARWYRDAKSYDAHSDLDTRPGSWPYLAINCPALAA